MLNDVDILSWLDSEETVPSSANVKVSTHSDISTSEIVSGTCFEIKREVLLSLLEKAITVVPSKDMVPVLTNFQFRVGVNDLTVIASSMENSIVVSTDQVKINVPGIEVFPARTLLNVVKEAVPGVSIYIEVTTSGLVVVAGSFSVELKLMPGKDFPPFINISSVDFHEVNRDNFIAAVSNTKYALPGKDYSGQAALKMISVKGGKFTACDGSRFQQMRIDGFKLHMKLASAGIPALLKILSSSDLELLEVGELDTRYVFRLSNTLFFMNKLGDVYPNVEQLWLRPALTNDQELLVSRKDLITAIKQVRIVADTSSNAIGLTISANEIRIQAKNTNNSADVSIVCEWKGSPRNVVVNYIHLAEMLKVYPKDDCKFLLGEDTKTRKAPLLLKDDDTYAISTISQMNAYR